MERRAFLKKSAVVAAGGGFLTGCTRESSGPAVQTRKTVRWRLASSFPRTLDTIFGAADRLSKRISELTDGNFKIRVFPAGEIVPGLQVLDSVRDGTVELGHSASYYFIGKEAALAFDTAVPFGLTARQQTAWLCEAGGLELMRELFQEFNVINFPGGNTGVQMGGWFREPVHSLADLKGLKMRIPGLGGEVMSQLGVTVQVLAAGEIYPALERGTIDATEWVGPYDDQKLGFHQVARHYHYPGWWEPGPGLSFYVNKDAWEELPATYQAAIDVASREATLAMMNEYDAKNPPALKELLAAGVKLVPFPPDVLEAARSAMDVHHGELTGNNARYRKIFEHWSKFKQDSSRWFSTAEQAYASFVYRP